jgi:spore germination cell wall hydrolase CwlJ-like protein
MVASRKRPKGAGYYGPFGLSLLAMSLMPRQIGYQDLVALMVRQPDVSQRARAHMLASPFGTIHAATFSLPQPLGTEIPEPPVLLASFGGSDPENTGSIASDPFSAPLSLHRPRLDFPTVNRRLKGDLLVKRPRDEELPPAVGTHDLTPGRVKTVSFPRPVEPPADQPGAAPTPVDAAATPADVSSKADVVTATLAAKPEISKEPGELTPVDLALTPETGPPPKPAVEHRSESRASSYVVASLPPSQRVKPAGESPLAETVDDTNDAVRLGQLYFGRGPVGEAVGSIQPWPMDEELLIETPAHDPDIKRSALASPSDADFNFETPSATPVPGEVTLSKPATSETVAPKGEVTGVSKRPKTPAERLNLDTRQRAKSEKCLADAVYFESRGEPKRGQIAVAQVVMNRVFSGFYPNNVCGVVYQNANRKLACQFTFACDGIPDVVDEPDMWKQATEIAHDMLDGKLWLPEIGYSTHYHAYWVHPSWVNEMKKLYKIGVHSFYRPRAWGDTVEVPNYTFVPPHAKM